MSAKGGKMAEGEPFEPSFFEKKVLYDFPCHKYEVLAERLSNATVTMREFANHLVAIHDELVAFMDALSHGEGIFIDETAEKTFFQVMTVYTRILISINVNAKNFSTVDNSTQTDLEIQTEAILEEKDVEMPLSPPDSLPEDKKKKKIQDNKGATRKRISSSTSNDSQEQKKKRTSTEKAGEPNKKSSNAESEKPTKDAKLPIAPGKTENTTSTIADRVTRSSEKKKFKVVEPSTSAIPKTSLSFSNASASMKRSKSTPTASTKIAPKRKSPEELLFNEDLRDKLYIFRQAEMLHMYGEAKKNGVEVSSMPIRFTRRAARTSMEEQVTEAMPVKPVVGGISGAEEPEESDDGDDYKPYKQEKKKAKKVKKSKK